MAKCKKFERKVLFVDDTSTYLEVDGELVKQLGSGDLPNRNCVRCTFSEQYEIYKHFDET